MKILTGKIISTKMNKTATIEVVRFVAHPLYQKRMKRTKKYQVHDEVGHKVNEVVDFVACAPISKSKKWKIVEKAGAVKPTKAEKVTEKPKVKATKKVEVKAKVSKTKKA